MRISNFIKGSLATLTAFGLATPALSAEVLFNTNNNTKAGEGRIFSDGDTKVRVSAWSIINGVVRDGHLGIYNQGAGVTNDVRGDSHTIDNGGSLDFLVLQFNDMVSLTNADFRTGFHGKSDTDATIGYANSLVDFASQLPLDGISATQLSSIGNLFSSNAARGNSVRNINPGAFAANTWLIGASFNNPDHRGDGFKLRGVEFDVVTPMAPVPEPATWALMLIGFAVVSGTMRSRKKTGRLALA
ncbi:MAG: PEPxxWA-CTERM sorting domain-containing protein [Pontixanthobacter sp.]